jgi:hypothetical protein
VFETWYDPEAQAARWAMYSASPEVGGGAVAPATATYYVLDADRTGSGTIRQYTRHGDDWRADPGGSQMDASADNHSPGVNVVESEALAWLRAVEEADGARQLHQANLRFAARTSMWFSPPTAPGDDAQRRSATGAMQVLYLLRIAQVDPQAVAQLYRDVADLQSLERLEDGRVDERRVLRLRLFDAPKLGGVSLENVLLLDAETGAPVGSESEDGSLRTTFEPARRAGAFGEDPQTCGSGAQPPCELLRGEGPVAAAADRVASRVDQPLDPTPGPITDGQDVGNGAMVAPAQ